MASFGQQIKEARERKGLTQEQFAKELGVSQQSVAQWELDKASPRGVRMEQIENLLGINRRHGYFPPSFTGAPDAPPASFVITNVGSNDHKGYIADCQRRFVKALPEQLQQFCNVTADLGTLRYLVDYLSPRVCVEIKVVGSPSRLSETRMTHPILLRSALWLMSTVRLATLSSSPDRRYILIPIIGNEAAMHGIQLHEVTTPERAAAIVTAMEQTDGFEQDDEPDLT
jgi:transcriptional regulator with XRE-family HTH domain